MPRVLHSFIGLECEAWSGECVFLEVVGRIDGRGGCGCIDRYWASDIDADW